MANQAAPANTPSGVTAPAGGFQNGGWYGGAQYNAATNSFGTPGVITNPNQQGAGQKVSSAVVAQTNPNNVGYINQQSGNLQTPTNPNDMQAYLNNYQGNINQSISGSNLTGNNAEAVMGQAINENRPQPPNLSQTYQGLAGQYNIGGLNQKMTDLQTQANTIQTSLQTAQTQTEFQPGVTADVVAGRESEQQRLAQIQLDSVNLQMGVVSQQLTNANNSISMIMQFTQQDYTNASQAFDASFQEAYQIQSLIQSQSQFQQQMQVQQQQFQQSQSQQAQEFTQGQQQQAQEFGISASQTEEQMQQQQAQFKAQLGQQAQQVASANWQAVTNMIISGQINPANLTQSQQAHIQSLETQAGLPAGITSMITSNIAAGSKILSTNPNTGQALIQLANGKLQTMDIPNSTIQPQSIPFAGKDYMYQYDPSSGQYQLAPGQKSWLQNLLPGIFPSPPSTIQAGQMNAGQAGGQGLSVIDPKTGNIYQASNQQEYQQAINQGFKPMQ